jgi:hypothetical protein
MWWLMSSLRKWIVPTALVGAVLLSLPSPAPAAGRKKKGRKGGDAAKAAKLVEAANAALQGGKESKKPDLRTALKLFKRAKKVAGDDPALEHLTAQIGVGMAKAYVAGKKVRDAAKVLEPVVRRLADTNLHGRKLYLKTPEAKAWKATLEEAFVAFGKGKANTKLCTSVLEAAMGIEGDRMLKYSLGPAAQYCAGKVHLQRKETQKAVDVWLPGAERQARTLAAAAKRRAEMEAKRVKTPTNLPAGNAPPGELSGKYQQAVDDGLAWLAKFQAEDGSWSDETLAAANGGTALPAGRVKVETTTRGTALAVMALIRAGVKPDHPVAGQALTKGLGWITAAVTAGNGRVAPRGDREAVETQTEFVWALALAVERLPAADQYQEPLQQAVNWLQTAQNPGAGWRYGIRPGDNDSDNTAPALIALLSARRAGAKVEQEAIDGAVAWLDRVTDTTIGKTGFMQRGDNGAARMDNRNFKLTEIATAMTLCTRALNGEDLHAGLATLGYDLLWGCTPGWEEEKDINIKYMKYFTMAYALRPGRDANAALKPVADLLVKHQESKGAAKGSWAPVTVYSHHGRCVVTARALLAICNARGVNLPQLPKPEAAADK